MKVTTPENMQDSHVESLVDTSHSAPSEKIFFDGTSYFNELFMDIDRARSSIDLEVYIFANDSLGSMVAKHLIAASERGVHVRVLVDGVGSLFWGGNLAFQLERAGVNTRIFHPFPFNFWQWSHSWVRVSILLKAIYLLLKINSRNHRKTCIIDNKIVYVGSFNISQRHLGYADHGENWRDAAIRLQTTDVEAINMAFEAAWDHLPLQERLQEIFKPVKTNPTFRLNYTRHLRRALYKGLLRRLAKCRRRIWIANAYFVPDNFLLKKLKDAARKGIDVRILLPQRADVFIIPWASAAFYRSLLISGVRIFEYLPTMFHAKTLILDDWMMVGSSNLNHRSLLHDLEIDVAIHTVAAKNALSTQFISDLNQAKEIFLDRGYYRPWYQRLLGRLFLYLKYWI